MRVMVDPDLCEANGVCANLVPQVFDLDEEDELHIADGEVPDALAGQVRLAVQSCPKMALRIEDQA
jgi:ferredoxin